MEAKNIDDTLVKLMSNEPVIPTEVPPVVASPNEPEAPKIEAELPLEAPKIPVETPEIAESETKPATDSPIDEYGNPVEKAKTYTEEEVQRMIRDRLSRGKYAEQQQPIQNTQPPQQEQTEEGEEDWRTQLRKEIRSEMTQAQKESQEYAWRQQQADIQSQFESKFTTGMSKYSDFQQVVADKPITDTMLMAARNLDNPAAFIYGAAKLHPQELSRIAQINDPYAQASEIGRLHERMVKERKGASSSPRPLEAPKGDIPQKNAPHQIPIDERIHNYAKQKRK
jgi:hypothetical protein